MTDWSDYRGLTIIVTLIVIPNSPVGLWLSRMVVGNRRDGDYRGHRPSCICRLIPVLLDCRFGRRGTVGVTRTI